MSQCKKTTSKWFISILLTFFLAGAAACQSTTPLNISGIITGSDGIPPKAAYIILLSADDFSLVSDPAVIDDTGSYYFNEVQGGHDYFLIAIPISGQTEAGYNLHGYTPQITRLEETSGIVSKNLILPPCHDFIFEAYRTDGSLILNDDWVGLRFVEDMAGSAGKDIFSGIDKGDERTSAPSLCIPLGQTRRFFFQTSIPGFGNIVLPADNEGNGYIAVESGGTVLNLNYELARTQVNRLRTNLSEYKTAGYDTPAIIMQELTLAENILSNAAILSGPDQAATSDRATSTALWALENLELARAEQDIPRYRMGTTAITVLDEIGNPLSDATITYTQINHDFLFGIFDTLESAGSDGYSLMQEAGINYLTTGFYWSETEPEQNELNWEYIDHNIGVLDLAEMGFTIKSHALLALWDFATPDYLKEMSFDEFDREVYEHTSSLVNRYQDQIEIWNVINEAHGRSASLDFSRAEITTLTQTGIRAIRENDPDARIIINNAFDWYGESRAMEVMLGSKMDNYTLSIPAYLDQIAADGIEYDIIGQQLYNGGYVSLFADWGLGDPMGVPTWDMEHHSAILDQLGEYGKPVHITEQSVPSSWKPEWEEVGTGWWHHPWDEEIQAEFVHNFYTIAFSKEQVEAVTWWNINDDNDCFIVSGGFLDENNRPKLAYFALRDLITGWTSSGQIMTDAAGQLTIHGYGGEYSLTITDGNQTWQKTIHIFEQQQGEITIELTNTTRQ